MANERKRIDSNTNVVQLRGGSHSSGSGDGGSMDGMLEARVAKLEALSEHVVRDLGELKADVRELRRDARTDFRMLFGAIIFVALGLAGLMAKGFQWL